MPNDLNKEKIIEILNSKDVFDHIEPCIIYSWGGEKEEQFNIDDDINDKDDGKGWFIEDFKRNFQDISITDIQQIHNLQDICVAQISQSIFVFKDNKLFKQISLYELRSIVYVEECSILSAYGKDGFVVISSNGVVVEKSY